MYPSSSSSPRKTSEGFSSSRSSERYDSQIVYRICRARILAKLDEAPVGTLHVRIWLTCGLGFLAASYENFVANLILPLLYHVNYPTLTAQPGEDPYQLPSDFPSRHPDSDAWMKASILWGNLVGQISFGYLADRYGRRAVFSSTMIIMIVCTIGSAFSASAIRGANILQTLAVWRFFLGIGIGGDYPLSAIITSEFANVKWRGTMIAAVFAMQGIGILTGGLVTLATLAALQNSIRSDPAYLDLVWRIILAFGVIPAMGAVYFRLTIPETPRYTVDVIGSVDQAERDVEKVMALNATRDVSSNWVGEEVANGTRANVKKGGFWAHFGQWKNGKILFGCAFTWFALDVAWYGLSLNASTILTLINWNGSNSLPPYDNYWQKTVGQVIIACMGTVPGYWVCVALIDRTGRLTLQGFGFAVITVSLLILALFWETIATRTVGFCVLYGLASFFFQCGPNATTFILPAELFPTPFRARAYGIAAAMGKLGAIIGVQIFSPIFASNLDVCLYCFAGVMALGGMATLLVPETNGVALETLEVISAKKIQMGPALAGAQRETVEELASEFLISRDLEASPSQIDNIFTDWSV
ncbi:major facilitator superfamily domain-containing protein [Polychytrium aggregatum]|uniref:major facilitator superfamily domain-containing protein n=1 Tax=Polychytrium aggregatum TaxID=110093 RepID=UPI0022FE68F9|nr:major facilitator superfamily domain-containing protein [Polychytrium aggregatum]KAI9206029.1 major facilitator superfamily domain-containing protein [Polychytrium aggregatum]